MVEITVDVWSDLVCPWCFIGKRRFEAALEGFEHRDAVRVRWRSFELDPNAPTEAVERAPELLQRKYGMTAEQAAEANARVTTIAAEVGLTYRLDESWPVNSFDAHRVMHFAADQGVGDAVRERLMTAYTSEGVALGDRETLVAEVTKAGLDEAATWEVLKGDRYADAVRADEREAAEIGVRGVPAFVANGRYLVSGAQPVEVFERLLRTAAG
ncbi:DsbA family oxidoreductase [Actinomadura sp. SCN-SB]|uniref:DsbA family oxidoreductase n=1 Tax=Actinomadura sp. SCN-SB TaxID=3373092 RepID=UPI00375113DA